MTNERRRRSRGNSKYKFSPVKGIKSGMMEMCGKVVVHSTGDEIMLVLHTFSDGGDGLSPVSLKAAAARYIPSSLVKREASRDATQNDENFQSDVLTLGE